MIFPRLIFVWRVNKHKHVYSHKKYSYSVIRNYVRSVIKPPSFELIWALPYTKYTFTWTQLEAKLFLYNPVKTAHYPSKLSAMCNLKLFNKFVAPRAKTIILRQDIPELYFKAYRNNRLSDLVRNVRQYAPQSCSFFLREWNVRVHVTSIILNTDLKC